MMRNSWTRLLRAARSLALLLPLVVASFHLSAQSPQASLSATQSPTVSQAVEPSLQFEVASIRPNQSAGDQPSNRQILPGGRFVATATTVRTLMRIAFGTDDNLLSGAPSWTNNETFDINATTVNRTEVTTPQQFQQLILSLLEDRFLFKFHSERKEARVYWLELDKPGKLGPALKPSPPGSQPNMSTNSSGLKAAMKVSKMSMADIAAGLRRQAGRPVEDHTGLEGNFDFQIEWAPEETPGSEDASLFTVLKEQLGLKLQPAKGMVEFLIVDRISHPTAN
jgi:uncharacterized protein (TIGR03435 family)